MTVPKSSQIIPPGCERGVVWCCGVILFLFSPFHILNCRECFYLLWTVKIENVSQFT